MSFAGERATRPLGYGQLDWEEDLWWGTAAPPLRMPGTSPLGQSQYSCGLSVSLVGTVGHGESLGNVRLIYVKIRPGDRAPCSLHQSAKNRVRWDARASSAP